MNKTIYLSNGQQAELINELPDGKFLVDPICSYQDYYTNEWFDMPSNGYQIVDKVFSIPPTERISKELKELQDKVYEERKKLNDTTKEYNDLSFKLKREAKEADDLSKWKIDLSKFKLAKEVSFFLPDGYLPIKLKQPKYASDRDIKVNFNVSVYDGVTSEWGVKIRWSDEDRYWTDAQVDEQYGFMYDISDDELEAITIDRINGMDFTSVTNTHKLNELPERYRTDAWRARYDFLLKEESNKNIANLTKEIEEFQERIKEHEEKLKTIS